MTSDLEQTYALMEHFRSEVLPTASVASDGVWAWVLRIPVPTMLDYALIVRVANTRYGLRVTVGVPNLPTDAVADDIARVGGMLIQISNLVRQIRALAGGNASDSSRSQAAV